LFGCVIPLVPVSLLFFLLIRPPPLSTLFPYTTLFRSVVFFVTSLGLAIIAKQRAEMGVQDSSLISGDLNELTIEQQNAARQAQRSEEHTSELQSRENLVCRLLLEKKKKKTKTKET